MKINGRVHRFGDNINTDEIIPARYLVFSNPKELAMFCFENLSPNFSSSVKMGDVIVAGSNFGCGSSREHAALAIKETGISCVIAKSFARLFYRNAINIGLPILEIEETESIEEGDELKIDTETGKVFNLTKLKEYLTRPFSPFIEDLIKRGGLMEYARWKIQRGYV